MTTTQKAYSLTDLLKSLMFQLQNLLVIFSVISETSKRVYATAAQADNIRPNHVTTSR